MTPVSSLFPGTWYLVEVDDKHRRVYDRKPVVSMRGDSSPEVLDVQVNFAL